MMPKQCSRYLDGSGLHSYYRKVLGDTPQVWAEALVKNTSLRQMFLHRAQDNEEHFYTRCVTSMIMWPQSAYVSDEQLHRPCMPSMVNDVQKVLSDAHVSCSLKERHSNHGCESCMDGVDVNYTELTSLVKQLYPEDFQQWNRHCQS